MTDDRPHGPLPVLLVGLTVVTGLVDAFSYLRLGQVFVANMTGNVVFLGFALAGVGDISVVASLFAVLAFALGAAVGGRWAAGRVMHRGHLLAAATSVQAGLVLVASAIASAAGAQGSTVRLTLIGLLALAMGCQNAVVRRLAVPDLTTTVLTLTVTGLVADTTPPLVRARRLISVLAMLAGALAGGVLLRWVALAAPLRFGGSSAGRLCCGRLRGDQPPTSAGLAVAPTDIRRRVGKPRRSTRSVPSPPRYSDKQRPAASCFPAGLEIRVTTSATVASGFDDCVARTSLHCRRTCDVRVGIRCLCRPARERALDVVDAPDVTRGGAGCYRRASMARLASAASMGGMYTRPPLSRSSVRPSAAVAAGGPQSSRLC
jgi:uncharacterized membrane protein YoaK (UPF0700 family)